jgi:uncharacterized protein (UPF0212 family)
MDEADIAESECPECGADMNPNYPLAGVDWVGDSPKNWIFSLQSFSTNAPEVTVASRIDASHDARLCSSDTSF